MPRTGLVHHVAYTEHDTGAGHPECPARVDAIERHLRSTDLWERLTLHAPREASPADLEAVHTGAHVARLAEACHHAPTMLDPDTPVSAQSFRAARLASGGTLEAVDRVLDGRWRNAFVCARPPGHHAERGRAMGFCLVNHVAVAAAHLRAQHGLERVCIVDWDVHHGNGTQHAFEDDPTVFYASLHQFPFYPGTGAADERGRHDGEGFTLNCPQPAGSGDAEWLATMEQTVLPALEDFDPDFVLISAGFDGHALDPLGGCALSDDAYRVMSEMLLDLAGRRCQQRVVSVLEGGYHLAALASSCEAHLRALVGCAG